MICGAGTPLLPIQLLWLNVVTDGFQDLSLSLEKPESNIMFEKPRSTKESLFTKLMINQCLILGGTIGLIVFATWIIFVSILNYDLVVARTLVMTLMVFLQNAHAFNCRSEKQSFTKTPIRTNKFFIFAVLGSIALQILFIEVSALSKLLDLTTVDYATLAVLLGASLIVLVVSEIYKLIVRKKEMQLL